MLYLFVLYVERFTLCSQLISYYDTSLYDSLHPVVTHGSCPCTCAFFFIASAIWMSHIQLVKKGDKIESPILEKIHFENTSRHKQPPGGSSW